MAFCIRNRPFYGVFYAFMPFLKILILLESKQAYNHCKIESIMNPREETMKLRHLLIVSTILVLAMGLVWHITGQNTATPAAAQDDDEEVKRLLEG